MAAAARPPGPSDARVPCPLCGGLVHPVAGRCKHCKADLTAFRTGRPQATTPLPPLLGGPSTAPVAPAGPAAVPAAVPAHEPSQPVLPPRPTGQSLAAQRPRAAWRQWPTLVIALAVVAIVAAVVILVWPQGKAEGKHALQPPPAPERMDTDPIPAPGDLPPSAPGGSSADPWGSQGRLDPPPAPPQQAIPQPPPPDDDDRDDILGLLQQVPGGTGGTGGIGGGFGGNLSTPVLVAAMRHACDRLSTCPNADATLESVCSMVRSMPAPPPPAGCAAAQRCLDQVDRLSCSQAADADPMTAVMLLRDCTAAATSC